MEHLEYFLFSDFFTLIEKIYNTFTFGLPVFQLLGHLEIVILLF